MPKTDRSVGPLITREIKDSAIAELETIKGLIQNPDTDDLAYIRKTVSEQIKALIDALT